MTEANHDSACLDRLSFRPSSGRIDPSVLSVRSVVKLFMLFLAEFLEARDRRAKPQGTFRSQCLRSADIEALGRNPADIHNETGKPTFSSKSL
jgi:hypothetical protein